LKNTPSAAPSPPPDSAGTATVTPPSVTSMPDATHGPEINPGMRARVATRPGFQFLVT
jgi:hypothetical protein